MKKQLAVILALSATLGVSTIIPQTAPHKVEAATQTPAPTEMRKAIDHLNEIRNTIGLQPIREDSALNRAASSHAKFLNLNGSHYGKTEVEGL